MTTDDLREHVNKRLTLNLLIQGAAQHAFLTSHYVVRDELNAISGKLLLLYDKTALAAFIQFWGDGVIITGFPRWYWWRARTSRHHPYFDHPLLSRHGGALASAAKKRAYERCREKGVITFPVLGSLQLLWVMTKIKFKEWRRRRELIELAKRATHRVWGISPDQLDAALTHRVAFGKLSWPKCYSAFMLRICAVAFGGVLHDGERLKVVAKAPIWPILSHELVKGTVELICMHGVNEWDEEVYTKVMKKADRIEHEPWMMQAGAELWRQLLPLLPDGRPIAEMVMHIARLPARSLDALMLAVVEKPEWAKELLAALGQDD